MKRAVYELLEAEDVFEIQDDDIGRYAVVCFAPESEEVAMTDIEEREFRERRNISKNSQRHERATEFDSAGFDPAPFKPIDKTF